MYSGTELGEICPREQLSVTTIATEVPLDGTTGKHPAISDIDEAFGVSQIQCIRQPAN